MISPGLRGTSGVPGQVEVHLYICRGFKTKSCQQRKARRGGLPTGCPPAHPAGCVIIRPNTFFTPPPRGPLHSHPVRLRDQPQFSRKADGPAAALASPRCETRVVSGLDDAAAQRRLLTDSANHASRCAAPHFSHEDKKPLAKLGVTQARRVGRLCPPMVRK